jgi:hypothetical protein
MNGCEIAETREEPIRRRMTAATGSVLPFMPDSSSAKKPLLGGAEKFEIEALRPGGESV